MTPENETHLSKQILVSVDRAETRVAIMEDGRAAEVYIERRGQRSVVGHVWKGRVENVLAGVERPSSRSASKTASCTSTRSSPSASLTQAPDRRPAQARRRVLVQATKDPMGTKGARLTMQLSLAGRFVVYVPYGDGIGVSKRLADDERSRLRSICGAPLGRRPDRPHGAAGPASEIARDLAYLKRLWATLQERAAVATAPKLLYSECRCA